MNVILTASSNRRPASAFADIGSTARLRLRKICSEPATTPFRRSLTPCVSRAFRNSAHFSVNIADVLRRNTGSATTAKQKKPSSCRHDIINMRQAITCKIFDCCINRMPCCKSVTETLPENHNPRFNIPNTTPPRRFLRRIVPVRSVDLCVARDDWNVHFLHFPAAVLSPGKVRRQRTKSAR